MGCCFIPRNIHDSNLYEVVCYPSHHIHNNSHTVASKNFPFKCFQIASPALHMLIPRLMMRKAQIYRIQNFCHGSRIPGCRWGRVWFSIQYFQHIMCHARPSRILKCLFKYVTHNWNISPHGINGNVLWIDTKLLIVFSFDILVFTWNEISSSRGEVWDCCCVTNARLLPTAFYCLLLDCLLLGWRTRKQENKDYARWWWFRWLQRLFQCTMQLSIEIRDSKIWNKIKWKLGLYF